VASPLGMQATLDATRMTAAASELVGWRSGGFLRIALRLFLDDLDSQLAVVRVESVRWLQDLLDQPKSAVFPKELK
jgi:hypothetical protein